jgi:hypothetical protein
MESQQSADGKKRKNYIYVLPIRPRRTNWIEFGTYPSEAAIPEFSIEFLPDEETISTSETHLPMKTGIRVVFHFENYRDKTAVVLIEKR